MIGLTWFPGFSSNSLSSHPPALLIFNSFKGKERYETNSKRKKTTICSQKQDMQILIAFFLNLLLLTTLPAEKRVEAAIDQMYSQIGCGSDLQNTTEYSPNSTFQTNLNFLLTSLSSSNSTAGSGGSSSSYYYRNSTAGSGSDTIYGSYLCRGDINSATCRECVSVASGAVVRNCARVRTAIVWYAECMLRHSDDNFFSRMDEGPRSVLRNRNNVSDPAAFMRLVGAILGDAATRAATDGSPPARFAVGVANFTSTQQLYAAVQCTPDLTTSDCDKCLRTGIAQVPRHGSQGARALLPSCTVRYELYPFYNQAAAVSAAAPPPPPQASRRPPLPPPAPGGIPEEKNKVSSTTIIAIVVPLAVCLVLIPICWHTLRRMKKKYEAVTTDNIVANAEITTGESLQYDFCTIVAATNNFSDDNKIGEGGFGAVYKGTLPNGTEVAMKRLSRSSGQGVEEFKNEAVVVAKLQHRNLVRLLGFCLEGVEKILIYEYVPNKSLDNILFDPQKRWLLDWSRRYKIIGGIARAMLYLHEDSRLRIIHRDLKVNNILLDEDMGPKVSDFGMARIFGVDQTQGNTSKIVGTFGYMAPEYALHGHFSIKSDVFSFGVLVLEIISGNKNSNFYESDGAQDLISHAWRLWRDGIPLDLMDPTLRDSYVRNEIIRCIHIGLLCVQDDEAARPTMATVVLLLNSYSVTLPTPKEPAFFFRSRTGLGFPQRDMESGSSISKSIPSSVNEVSISEVEPR